MNATARLREKIALAGVRWLCYEIARNNDQEDAVIARSFSVLILWWGWMHCVLAQGTVFVGSVSSVITNPAPARGDAFGFPIAAVGPDKIVIGAYLDDTGAPDAGAAYLFSTNGTLVTTFTNPAPALRDHFGFRLAAVGTDKVVIGAYEDGPVAAGAAYLFSTNGALLATFTNPVPWGGDNFGIAVGALGPDRLLIGASSHDGGNTSPGAAFLFSTNGTLLTAFTNPAPDWADGFGWALGALGTDKVLIGAQQDDEGAFDSGIAYLFTTNGTLITTFTNPAPGHSDYFGGSLTAAVGGHMVLIGARSDDTGATEAGAAYLFNTNGTLLTTFTNPSPRVYDHFGSVVAQVDAETVLIGAPGEERLGAVEGTVYLFNTKGVFQAALTGPPSESRGSFGAGVAVLGNNRFAVGFHQDDTGADDAGAAYLFGLRSIPRPALSIERTGLFNARVSWPLAAAGFRLEETSPFGLGGAWLEFTTLYETNATHRFIIVPAVQNTFYRLSYP